MKLFMVLFLLGIPTAAPVLHSRMVFYTLTSDIPNVPEFMAVYVIDEVQTIYYDSNTKRAEPRQDWVNKVTEDDPKYWEERTQKMKDNHSSFKDITESGLQRLNSTGGRHIVQAIFGCDWDDETDEVNTFNKFGLEGDFIALDLKTQTWIALSQQAVVIKEMLEDDKPLLTYFKNYLTLECPDGLKKFLNYGKISLMRKDLPSVFLLQKTPSSPVTCHATGFYPDRADLFWKKDEDELHEDVVRGEILHNHDGSFQMSVDLDLSGVKDEDWGRYSCVFQLAGVQEDVLTTLDKRVILTNWEEKRSEVEGIPIAAIGVVTSCLGLLIGGFVMYIIMRRNISGFRPANSSPQPGEDEL